MKSRAQPSCSIGSIDTLFAQALQQFTVNGRRPQPATLPPDHLEYVPNSAYFV